MRKLILLLTIAALICLTLPAMADGDGITFNTDVNALTEGATLQTVLAREGEAAGGELTYTSSNPKVATVDENGLVTAVQKGNVAINAVVKTEKKSYKAQLKLTVIRPVASLTVNLDKLPVYAPTDPLVAPYLTARENAEENELQVLLLPVKKRYQLKVAAEPRDASNRNLTFASSDESIFTAAKGNVTGVAPGEGILTIGSESNPEVTQKLRVLVIQPVKKLTVEASEPVVVVGQQITVKATANPEDATMQNVIWSSGDERIVTVDANGTVTGVKRGTGRIIATATDGSNVRANFSIKVVQNPESITLSTGEVTVDVGRNAACKATVEPNNTDNKKVVWSSSDENIATVAPNGRITGKAVGTCTVTCTSEALGSVSASLTVHVQQPVTKLYFNDKSAFVYAGEGTQLAWTVEPENATNQELSFKSAKESIAVVDANGIVTGVDGGETKVVAMTTDGSNRKASIGIEVGKHVTGVKMVRERAYIDLGETATAGANIEPKDALNKNMSWESSDPNIVTCDGKTNFKMKLTAHNYGTATVTGTTEDGGFQTSLLVTVGDYDRVLDFQGFDYDGAGNTWLTVKNNSDFTITRIEAELELWDCSGELVVPAAINTKDGSNKVQVVWNGVLAPGERTGGAHWKMVNFNTPACGMNYTRGKITVCSYQIDGDWIKTIRTRNRPSRKWD